LKILSINQLVKKFEIVFKTKKRGVTPVIATLLLVAIAVVGGSVVFVFAQGYVSETQISGNIQPEYVKIIGYDSRDISPLKTHDGLDIIPSNCCGIADNKKNPDERIAIYVQNNSAQSITISELRVWGAEFQYVSTNQLGNWNGVGNGPQPLEYIIMTGNDGKPNGDVAQQNVPKIESGGIVTLVLDLDRTIPLQRDMQVTITTINGNTFVSTIISGQISE
jgi:flagellin-like protein